MRWRVPHFWPGALRRKRTRLVRRHAFVRCGRARCGTCRTCRQSSVRDSESRIRSRHVTDADWAALSGPWAWFDQVAGPALAAGPEGLIDDDIAYVTPWGFNCGQISCPVLVMHGAEDRIVPPSHSNWLAKNCPLAEQWIQPDDGHISVLTAAARGLAWIKEQASTWDAG